MLRTTKRILKSGEESHGHTNFASVKEKIVGKDLRQNLYLLFSLVRLFSTFMLKNHLSPKIKAKIEKITRITMGPTSILSSFLFV